MKCRTCGEDSDQEYCSMTCYLNRGSRKAPMTPSSKSPDDKALDLEAIKKRRQDAGRFALASGYKEADYYDMVKDLDTLIAEVERLREELKRTREKP